MKAVAIPTMTSGLTAAFSVLFFTGLSRVMGDDLLGRVILVQSAAAIVVMACVPQCWVYLIAARDQEDLVARYRRGFSAEAVGLLLGALIVIVAILALRPGDRWSGSLVIFASLAVQASSSCLGWLRAREQWWGYLLWVLGPNLIRVPLIWATPWLVTRHWIPDAQGDQAMVMAIYFLTPDLVRWLAIAMPIAIRHYRWPGLGRTIDAARVIMENWLFDVGSALTGVADRLVVGTLLGPQVLVAYFFARRLGIVATMFCEPFYAEQFRRIIGMTDLPVRSARQITVYLQGLGFALGSFAAMLAMVVIATQAPALSALVPAAVLALLPVFALVLLVDCLFAANRWSRFLGRLNGGNARLLGVRLSVFGLFVVNIWLFGNWLAGLGLAVAFALSWLLEATYISSLLGGAARRALTASGLGPTPESP